MNCVERETSVEYFDSRLSFVTWAKVIDNDQKHDEEYNQFDVDENFIVERTRFIASTYVR